MHKNRTKMDLQLFAARQAAKQTPPKKSMKMGADELSEMIKTAVKEALGEGDAPPEEEAADEGDVLGVVQDVVNDILEKRKARKEAGEEIDDATLADEIAEAVAYELGEDEAKEDESAEGEEEKASDGREEAREEGDEGKQKAAPRKHQSKSRPQSRRAPAAPSGRKYSAVYGGRENDSRRDSGNQKKIPPEILLARAVKCLDVFGRHDPDAAAFYAKKKYADTEMERQFKALSATVPSSGGYLIPEIYLSEIIELLYAKTVIYELGARKVPMDTGNLNIPKMTSGTRARWGGEARKIATTTPKFGNLKLSSKRLETIVPQTRELIMSTSYSADAIFANDLTRRMELGLDWGAMFGTGGDFQPVGIQNTKGILKVDATAIGNTDLAKADGELTADFPVALVSSVLLKNVDDLSIGWSFNSLIEGFLKNLKTSTGAYIYREEMNAGNLVGFPYKVSNQIELKNGATSIFFGNWADLLIGEQMGLETYTTLDGSWTDEDGVQHNAFEENLTGTRALMYVDTGVRHPESFAVVEKCKVPAGALLK